MGPRTEGTSATPAPGAEDPEPAGPGADAGAPEDAGPVADPGSDEVVELTDARAIRAIAHPARLAVVDALYDRGQALTATQAAELAGTSPSAMSYHLRALERYGLVRRAAPSADGRERPWVRAAKDLRIRPSRSTSRAVVLAASAVVATAMDVARERLLAAVERGNATTAANPLDPTTTFSTTAVIVTPEEATTLTSALRALLEPLREHERTDPPEGADRLTVIIAAYPDPDPSRPDDDRERS